ncbi:MAG: hypothetical protein Q7J06_09045 [Bacteroidales bacterium]|nr:hypothetical protein [Bacteroidales bacterium]
MWSGRPALAAMVWFLPVQVNGQRFWCHDKVIKVAVSGQVKKHPDESGQVVFGSEGTGCKTLACASEVLV